MSSTGDAYDRDRERIHPGPAVERPAEDAETCRGGADSGLLGDADADVDSDSDVGNRANPAMERAGTWRPTWLRPAVLSTFIALFLIFAASLATMLYISQRTGGLVEAKRGHSYLWRFGPTAVLTVVSIFWSRVEMQALRYMPWIALSHHHRQSLRTRNIHDFDVDYTAMMSPTILVQSLRRKHYLVLLVVVISLVLKIQIVLAPGLYNLETVRVAENTDIEILDLFNATGKVTYAPEKYDFSPYYLALATHNFEMRLPFGVTQHVAYQTFETVDGTRGTVNEQLVAAVDGYFTEAHCLKLERYSYSEIPASSRNLTGDLFNLRLWFESCEQSISINEIPSRSAEYLFNYSMYGNMSTDPWETQGIRLIWEGYSALSEPRPCERLSRQKNKSYIQSLFYAARFEKSLADSSAPISVDVAAVLCSSRSWISKVKVVDDGVNPFVTSLPDEAETPVVANLWDLIELSVPGIVNGWNVSWVNDLRGPIKTAVAFYGHEQVLDTDICTNETLYLSVMNMSRVLGPWVGHYQLREDATQPIHITGSKLSSVDKLILNGWICLLMAVLFSLLAVLLIVTLRSYRRITAIWCRDPATVLGNILFFRDNSRYVGEATRRTTRFKGESWSRCDFTPMVLKKGVRATFTVTALAIIVGLCATLSYSQAHEGLTTIDQQSSFYLLWSSVPTIIMLSVVLYVNCCDSAYRSLATLSRLSVDFCSAEEIDLSFSDMLGLRVLFRAPVGVVTLSQLLAIACGFLTSLGSVIFTLGAPRPVDILLQQKTWFGSGEIQNSSTSDYRRKMLSSLMLRQGERAVTYPLNTYDDLVFPVLSTTDNLTLLPNTSVKVTIPAAKLKPACWKLVPVVSNATDWKSSNATYDEVLYAAAGDIVGTFACPNGSQVRLKRPLPVDYTSKSRGYAYFAKVLDSPENELHTMSNCRLRPSRDSFYHAPSRTQTYVWGKRTFSVDANEFEHLSLWRCNYSWAEVPTAVHLTFNEGEYVLDPEKPPRPDLSGARPWIPPFDVPHVDNQFGTIGSSDGVFPSIDFGGHSGKLQSDNWFIRLVQPHGRLPLDAFADPNKDGEILEELHHLYGFPAAQLANLENRFAESSTSNPRPSLEPLEAVAVQNSRRRLVQDPAVTYAIVAILSFAVIANSWWLLGFAASKLRVRELHTRLFQMEVEGLAPDGFNSMGAMVALLRNSNIPNCLPEHVNLISSEELYSQLSGLGFRMGWFLDEKTQTKHYTVGVVGDEDFKFVGGKEHADKEKNSLLRGK